MAELPSPLDTGLAALVGAVGVEPFLNDYWQRRPLLVRLDHRAQLAVKNISNRLSPDGLSASHKGTIKVYGHANQGWTRTTADPGLMDEHDAGRTLYFLNLNDYDVGLNQWLQVVSADLGVHLGRVSMFASHSGARMPAHLDTAGNFTIQLSGRKRWRYSLETALDSPAANLAAGHPISGELRAHVSEPISWDPRMAEEVELGPGSMLYLPGGHWHETETLTDSVALSLTFDAHSWVDLLLDRLRWALLRRGEWRANAYELAGSSERSEIARDNLAQRISELAELTSTLKIEDFTDSRPCLPAIDETTLLIRHASANLTVDSWDAAAGASVGTVSFGGPTTHELVVTGDSDSLRAALEVGSLMTTLRGPVRAADILVACPLASIQTLNDLAALGILRAHVP